MKHRMLSLFLALLMCLSLALPAMASGEPETDTDAAPAAVEPSAAELSVEKPELPPAAEASAPAPAIQDAVLPEKVRLVSIGKAGYRMAEAAYEVLGSRIEAGVVIGGRSGTIFGRGKSSAGDCYCGRSLNGK